MRMLDCFCGMGGASEGFAEEGFDCTGIDVRYVNYPYKFIYKDMRLLDGRDFKGYDVIWGSPPCRDFSIIARTLGYQWKKPPNPKDGLNLVYTFLTFVAEAKPTIWIMENVHLLKNHLPIKPRFETNLSKGMKRAFWGNFPDLLIPKDMSKEISRSESGRLDWKGNQKLKSWERAKIPLPCSQAFAQACKDKLLEVSR